jgi:hypothetical protein
MAKVRNAALDIFRLFGALGTQIYGIREAMEYLSKV